MSNYGCSEPDDCERRESAKCEWCMESPIYTKDDLRDDLNLMISGHVAEKVQALNRILHALSGIPDVILDEREDRGDMDE